MELPIELQRYIMEFAKPMTRPDWRQGSYIVRELPFIRMQLLNELTNDFYLTLDYPMYLEFLVELFEFSDNPPPSNLVMITL